MLGALKGAIIHCLVVMDLESQTSKMSGNLCLRQCVSNKDVGSVGKLALNTKNNMKSKARMPPPHSNHSILFSELTKIKLVHLTFVRLTTVSKRERPLRMYLC